MERAKRGSDKKVPQSATLFCLVFVTCCGCYDSLRSAPMQMSGWDDMLIGVELADLETLA